MPLGSSERHLNPCRISRLDAARSTRDTPRDGSNDGVIPLPSYIDVSASQRAPKPTRPVRLNLESPR